MSDDASFRQPGGRVGSYHGSPFNQFKKLSREGMIAPSFHYAMFKAFLTDMAARTMQGESEEDLAAEVHPVLRKEDLIPATTFVANVLRWIHDFNLYLKGETEFECPEGMQHLLSGSLGKTPPTASDPNTDPDKSV